MLIMRIEIIIFLIAAFIIANIYTDGKYLKTLYSYKKYYQMAGVAFVALMLYVLIKMTPMRARQIVSASNDYLKYLPIDKNASNIISPILDFTSKQHFSQQQNQQYNYPIVSMQEQAAKQRLMRSGTKGTKRSVSETKKKFVASRQTWRCADCQNQLNAWFEVDHKVRLDHGGSNHVDNLEALCRECHGKKTALENL